MDTSRNTFTNVMCIGFSAVLAFLLCIAVGGRFEIDNIVSRAIIAASYCGVVVGLAFVLNRIIRKILSKGTRIDGDRAFLVSIIADTLLFVAIRILIIGDIIKIDFKTTSIYEMAKIGSDGNVFFNFSSVDCIFATMLSCLFKLFGNTYFPVYLLQFVLSAVAFALIVYSVNKICGGFASGFTGLGIAILPVFYELTASDKPDNLIILLFSFVLFLTAVYKNVIEQDRIKPLLSLIIGIVCGLFSLYSTMFMFVCIIPIIVLWDCRGEMSKDKAVNTFLIVLGYILSFFVTLLLDAYLFSDAGVIGFAEGVVEHLKYRFGFELNLNSINYILKDNGIYILIVLSIVYCVMFWKNEDDAAHIFSSYLVLLVLGLAFIRANYIPASAMLLAVLLLVVAGTGLYDLGYTESLFKVYKIEDDMEPPIITRLDDKITEDTSVALAVNSSVSEEKTAVTETVVAVEGPVVTETPVVEDPVATEIPVVVEEPVVTETAVVIETPVTDENPLVITEAVDSEVSEEEATEVANDDVNNDTELITGKYNTAEVRKETDYGINNADFESLFNNNYVPPKFVYKDIYSEEEPEENVEEEEIEEINESDNAVAEENVIEDATDSTDLNGDEADTMRNDVSDVKDKKAYVDSFFGYLYDGNDTDMKVEETVEPQKEEYVSHADKFADLDLDLGFDAFDNVTQALELDNTEDGVDADSNAESDEQVIVEPDEPVNVEAETIPEETVSAETEFTSEESNFDNISVDSLNSNDFEFVESENEYSKADEVEEFFFDFNDDSSDEIKSWEPLKENPEKSGEIEDEIFKALAELSDEQPEEELSIEEALERKIDKDFSYEEALNVKLDNEEIDKQVGFSFEEALEKKIAVENSINDAIEKQNFSYEEALNDKLVAEESLEEALENDYVSYEHTVSGKIGIEEIIDDHISHDFSFQEAIETKLDVEQKIVDATNEKLLEEFGPDHLFENVTMDFGGQTEIIDEEFTLNETIEDSVVEEKEDIEESSVIQASEDVAETLIYEETADASEQFDVQETEEITENVLVETETEDTQAKPVEETQDVNKVENTDDDKVEFIENPLPLPKKHVPREMDYGRVIPSAWMHYDVEIDKSNNFYDI